VGAAAARGALYQQRHPGAGGHLPSLQFDVVHCSGMLYHMPDSMRFLAALRKITREYLVLTSAVTATRVKTTRGAHDPGGNRPLRSCSAGRECAVLKAYWQRFVGDGAIGLTRETAAWRPDDFAPWWWLQRLQR